MASADVSDLITTNKIMPGTRIIALSDIHADMDALIICLRDCAKVIEKDSSVGSRDLTVLRTATENIISSEVMKIRTILDDEYLERQLSLDLNTHEDLYDITLGYRWTGVNTQVVLVGDIIDGKRGNSTKTLVNGTVVYLNQYPQIEIKILMFINELNRQAQSTRSNIFKVMGNHEHMNIMGIPDVDKYAFSNYNDNNYTDDYYKKESRFNFFKLYNIGYNLLLQDGLYVILKINNIVFVHGQLQSVINKQSLEFYENLNNWLNRRIPDMTNTYNDFFNKLTTRDQQSIIWAREYGDYTKRQPGVNICEQINRDIEIFCPGDICGDKTKIRIVVGHCPNFMDTNKTNPDNQTFRVFNAQTPIIEVGEGEKEVGPTDNNTRVYGISMECSETADIQSPAKLFKVDVGMSRGFEFKQNYTTNSIDSIKKFNDKFGSRVPQVLEITNDAGTDNIRIIRSTKLNTLGRQPRPQLYNKNIPNVGKLDESALRMLLPPPPPISSTRLATRLPPQQQDILDEDESWITDPSAAPPTRPRQPSATQLTLDLEEALTTPQITQPRVPTASTPIIYNVTIDWVRHGESCANLYQRSIVDKPVDRPFGYGKLELEARRFDETYENIHGPQFKSAKLETLDFEDVPEKEYDAEKLRREAEEVERQQRLKQEQEKSGWGWFTSKASAFATVASKAVASAATSVASDLSSRAKASMFYEPPLTFIGMQHAINLGNKYFDEEPSKNYDIYITSPLTRTITTALLSLRKRPDITIYVMPYINEHDKGPLDYQNLAVPSAVLKKRVKFIKDWLQANWIKNFDDIEIINDLQDVLSKNITPKLREQITRYLEPVKQANIPLSQSKSRQHTDIVTILGSLVDELNRINPNDPVVIKYMTHILVKSGDGRYKLNPRFVRGPKIDFSIYESYENLFRWTGKPDYITDPIYHNTNLFLSVGLYNLIRKLLPTPPPKDISIVAFCHGHFIKELWKALQTDGSYEELDRRLNLKDNLMNTAVIKQIFNYQYQDSVKPDLVVNKETYPSHFELIYNPERVRQTYQNFEVLNSNVCATQSIKGVTNNILKKPDDVPVNITDPNSYLDLQFWSDITDGYIKSTVTDIMQFNQDYNFNQHGIRPSSIKESYTNTALSQLKQIAGGVDYKLKYKKYKQKYYNLKNK